MKRLHLQNRTLGLLVVIIPLLALFIYVGLRSGPLAPVAVTLVTVESRGIEPALFGIGTVEARYTYKLGPTFAGRLQRLDVDVGDRVQAGQVVGEMEPIDLDERILAQQSALRGAESALRAAVARHAYAQTQAQRYTQLFTEGLTSEESLTATRQALQVADADLSAARDNVARGRHDNAALVAQRTDLRLIAPADGLITVRSADPGTTIVAGQTVVEIIDPTSLWINTRLDQISASGLSADLPAYITLRSRRGHTLQGRVFRVEPIADTVTEEALAKVVFNRLPARLPPVGELAEVTIDLPALPATAVIPNAALLRKGDQVGVWQVVGSDLHFTPVALGVTDLDGRVQIQDGLSSGDTIVLYSEKTPTARSRIHVVQNIPGASE
ncbi:MAG TPA: efflux transporter periplasmic adaptor subunit [Halieaceae bacterium]|nr:efflux transporter periplasmic adaptor subunit [Halieaceae bacterium]